jgi:hypothetical protein
MMIITRACLANASSKRPHHSRVVLWCQTMGYSCAYCITRQGLDGHAGVQHMRITQMHNISGATWLAANLFHNPLDVHWQRMTDTFEVYGILTGASSSSCYPIKP